ncbi:hypothetical protein SUGI_0304870 [Cryptomeria japonica]|uniref:DUF724 domain-containing protein 3 n=1 Tax=Cryptomeria japonica TaxID=3369 RepID=UPI002408D7CC|nr:DUF724 domain-containing protein 3 [Cryptomeria japonica]GLJ17532.1 hypothetical protein SUGI_0304870 [Cryptomeria japonica]
MDFNNGMKVEVCTNEEGYRGAWFEGTVVFNEGGGIYKVQHEKFENERKEPLVEDFHFTQIRPRPPKMNIKNWKVNDPVEIYDKHCWWRGVVSELLPDCYYSVHFPEYGEKVYCRSAMRVKQEWHNGKWSRSSSLSLKRTIEKELDYVTQNSPVKRMRIRVKGINEGVGQGAVEKQSDNVVQNLPVKRTRLQLKGLSEDASPSGVVNPKVSGSKVASSSKGKSLGVREELSDLRSRVTALENILGVIQGQLNVLLG